MAERKKPAVVKALIFKTETKNRVLDNNNSMKKGNRIFTSKLVPKELNFFDMTPNDERKPFKSMANNPRMKPSKMLVYEDSPGDNEPLKTTPPNVRERDGGTPGAPTKSRKDFEKKVLRPKKLVYNDADNGGDEDDLDEDYISYRDTPKKSSRKESDFVTTRRRIFARDSSTLSSGRVVDKPRSQAGNRDGVRMRTGKIDNLTCNKENNAAVRLGVRSNQEAREKLESHKSRTALGSREEFVGSSTKLRELTHFRI